MTELATFLAFLAATATFAYVPGPAMLYATAHTLAGGQKAGWAAVFGLHIGGYLHVIAAAFGIAILLQQFPVLYQVLKIGGGLVLIWLGLRMIWKAARTFNTPTVDLAEAPRFRDSMLVEALNPKTAVFYLAFLPQFISLDSAVPVWGQMLILGTIVNLMFSSADAICVSLAGPISRFVREGSHRLMWTQRGCGGLLVMIGVFVIASKSL